METFSALLTLFVGNSPVTGEFPSQRPVTRSFVVFFDLHLKKRLSKQTRCRWFETPSRSLWHYLNEILLPAASLLGPCDLYWQCLMKKETMQKDCSFQLQSCEYDPCYLDLIWHEPQVDRLLNHLEESFPAVLAGLLWPLASYFCRWHIFHLCMFHKENRDHNSISFGSVQISTVGWGSGMKDWLWSLFLPARNMNYIIMIMTISNLLISSIIVRIFAMHVSKIFWTLSEKYDVDVICAFKIFINISTCMTTFINTFSIWISVWQMNFI